MPVSCTDRKPPPKPQTNRARGCRPFSKTRDNRARADGRYRQPCSVNVLPAAMGGNTYFLLGMKQWTVPAKEPYWCQCCLSWRWLPAKSSCLPIFQKRTWFFMQCAPHHLLISAMRRSKNKVLDKSNISLRIIKNFKRIPQNLKWPQQYFYFSNLELTIRSTPMNMILSAENMGRKQPRNWKRRPANWFWFHPIQKAGVEE